MGRIKTAFVKRITKKLVSENRDQFKENFEENKKIVGELADIPSLKLRNVIAGYVTRIIKSKQEV